MIAVLLLLAVLPIIKIVLAGGTFLHFMAAFWIAVAALFVIVTLTEKLDR